MVERFTFAKSSGGIDKTLGLVKAKYLTSANTGLVKSESTIGFGGDERSAPEGEPSFTALQKVSTVYHFGDLKKKAQRGVVVVHLEMARDKKRLELAMREKLFHDGFVGSIKLSYYVPCSSSNNKKRGGVTFQNAFLIFQDARR
ncbi:hypothetical protein Btru_021533 [Bulinus truncatus]|nr:hypothetical protein Btru_021533 [Bulinus truncatus]